MELPSDLLLVRHAESEGNQIAADLATAADLSALATPGRHWRISERGAAEAAALGEWLRTTVVGGFARLYSSPYVRARQTAGLLGLPDAEWVVDRALRERDWGMIGSQPLDAWMASGGQGPEAPQDLPYWRPPGGESLVDVCDTRAGPALARYGREARDAPVLAVAHGDLMWSFRLLLEGWSDVEFGECRTRRDDLIPNCHVLWYSRRSPRTGRLGDGFRWLRRASVARADEGDAAVDATEWAAISPWRSFTNEELLTASGWPVSTK